MSGMDDHGVPPYLCGGSIGYWSAVRGPRDDDEVEEPTPREGSELTVMWDWGGGPLWSTEDGELPATPEWLRSALGLSESLTRALLVWFNDMDRSHEHPADLAPLHERGELLARRLQDEVGARFRVRYVG